MPQVNTTVGPPGRGGETESAPPGQGEGRRGGLPQGEDPVQEV